MARTFSEISHIAIAERWYPTDAEVGGSKWARAGHTRILDWPHIGDPKAGRCVHTLDGSFYSTSAWNWGTQKWHSTFKKIIHWEESTDSPARSQKGKNRKYRIHDIRFALASHVVRLSEEMNSIKVHFITLENPMTIQNTWYDTFRFITSI